MLGMTVQPGGWISSQELDKAPQFSVGGPFKNVGFTLVEQAHESEGDPPRLELEQTGGGDWKFRAYQGHTFEVPAPELLFDDIDPELDIAFHYTTFRSLSQIILSGGLHTKRTYIHLTPSGPPGSQPYANARRGYPVAIEVNLMRAKEEVSFVQSRSGSILTRGNGQGYLSKAYFAAVWVFLNEEWTRLKMFDPRLEAILASQPCGRTRKYLPRTSKTTTGSTNCGRTSCMPCAMDANWSFNLKEVVDSPGDEAHTNGTNTGELSIDENTSNENEICSEEQ